MQLHQCKNCSAHYKTEKKLEEHRKNKHMELTCPVCKDKFKRGRPYQQHINNAHPLSDIGNKPEKKDDNLTTKWKEKT